MGSMNATGGVAPIAPNGVAVRLLTDAKDKDLFLAAGAPDSGAVGTRMSPARSKSWARSSVSEGETGSAIRDQKP